MVRKGQHHAPGSFHWGPVKLIIRTFSPSSLDCSYRSSLHDACRSLQARLDYLAGPIVSNHPQTP